MSNQKKATDDEIQGIRAIFLFTFPFNRFVKVMDTQDLLELNTVNRYKHIWPRISLLPCVLFQTTIPEFLRRCLRVRLCDY